MIRPPENILLKKKSVKQCARKLLPRREWKMQDLDMTVTFVPSKEMVVKGHDLLDKLFICYRSSGWSCGAVLDYDLNSLGTQTNFHDSSGISQDAWWKNKIMATIRTNEKQSVMNIETTNK